MGNLEWRTKNRRQKHVLWLSESTSDRYKRDVREATKYIETAIIIDKAMFDKRNGSTRAEVVHDAIQVANIADLVSRYDSLLLKNLTRFLFTSDTMKIIREKKK